ncbi:hypothetical protein BJ742DRAFT_786356 [Cladochytrium replicatum]|nr:hypothetical protein BJ742DRAFT_786356 [Cladochytrium replicatum]
MPPTPTKKSFLSNRCKQKDCSDRAVKIVGFCRYCRKEFCGKHRLPEAHSCPDMQNCRDDATKKLTERLMSEKCVASKV